ncbi:adenylyl cyclase-associated protein [Venturia nashicola]|nr:adenylyl cyclase-associated protein [Venturia nashicola]
MTSNMNNLTTLIKRLEAATSRLEDIASSTVGLDVPPNPNGAPSPSAAVVPVPTEAKAPPVPPKEDLPPSIVDFDTLIFGDVKAYHTLSTQSSIGGLLREQADAFMKAFEAQRQFLLVTTKAKKPDLASPAYMDTLKGLQKYMTQVDDIRQGNRASPLKDHLAMIADGVGALAWVTIDPKPQDYVAELFGGAQLYGNKVLKEYKDKYAHVEWVRSFYKLMRSLVSYIKQHHPMGIQWNPQGVDAGQALREVQAAELASRTSSTSTGGSVSSSGGSFSTIGTAATANISAPPPPPLPGMGGSAPPPPPPPPGGIPTPKQKAAPTDMGAVFADLQRGENVTSGLKKVDPSQMTHKNPSLRATSIVPDRSDSSSSTRGHSPAPPGKKPKPESLRTKKPPKKELDGNKWIIENFDSPSSPVVIEAEINQSILITKCKGLTLQIKGKGNAISIDNSPKTSLIIDSLVSSVDVIKCPSFAVQIMEKVPTILLDQVDGAQIYLSKDSLATEVFTSKCSSVNINLPPASEEDDYKEEPIPEQFRSYIKGGKLYSEIVEHSG